MCLWLHTILSKLSQSNLPSTYNILRKVSVRLCIERSLVVVYAGIPSTTLTHWRLSYAFQASYTYRRHPNWYILPACLYLLVITIDHYLYTRCVLCNAPAVGLRTTCWLRRSLSRQYASRWSALVPTPLRCRSEENRFPIYIIINISAIDFNMETHNSQ